MNTKSGAEVTLLAIMNPVPGENDSVTSPEELIEWAGRTCYKSHDKITVDGAGKFVTQVIKRGHHSVLEHSAATFRIQRISRACSHQLVRHRLMAISQESQRYVDESGISGSEYPTRKRPYFVIPKAVQDAGQTKLSELGAIGAAANDTLKQFYRGCIKEIDGMYKALQEYIREAKKKGFTKAKVNEDARFLLPNACCTEIVITANFREFRHIFEMRCGRHAQWEIREVACEMLRQLFVEAPNVFKDLHRRLHVLDDDTEALMDD